MDGRLNLGNDPGYRFPATGDNDLLLRAEIPGKRQFFARGNGNPVAGQHLLYAPRVLVLPQGIEALRTFWWEIDVGGRDDFWGRIRPLPKHRDIQVENLADTLLGKLKKGDIPGDVRDACIRTMVELCFPTDTTSRRWPRAGRRSVHGAAGFVPRPRFFSEFAQFPDRISYDRAMKRQPNGKNVEVALQLLQLSLALKSAIRKAVKKR